MASKYISPYKSAPEGLFPSAETQGAKASQDGRWIRSQTMWQWRPPTESYKSGYVAVAILDEKRLPTGVFKVGLHPYWSKPGLEYQAQSAEMDFESYLRGLGNYWKDTIALKREKPPYLVNMVAATCTCPYYKKQKVDPDKIEPCFHYAGLVYVSAYHSIDGKMPIDPKTGRVLIRLSGK